MNDKMDTHCESIPPARRPLKDVGMRIRVDSELRDEFVRICKDNDVPAARVIRAFMSDFIRRNGDGVNASFRKNGHEAVEGKEI